MSGTQLGPSDAFLAAAVDLLGDEFVLGGDRLSDYDDPFPVGDPAEFAAGLVVRPATVEDVSALVRIAAEHGTTLWPISQGRNNGYGGRSPRTAGTVVLDLSRLDRVLEIDAVSGTALVEPGVRFIDLYTAVRASGAPFWTSTPDLSWGSVVGNALERGLGYTAYGEHHAQVCGLEVVLPDGEIVRTGMGAMEGGRAWQLYRPGFGPAVDGLFFQSNLGIVTKMGVWLMPAPEAWAAVDIAAPAFDDLAPLIDTMRPLKLDGTIQSTVVIGDPLGAAAFSGPRSEWQADLGLLEPGVHERIMERFGVGRWNMTFALYDHAELLEARIGVVERAFAPIPGARVTVTRYAGDAPVDDIAYGHRVRAGIPDMYAEKLSFWYGGRGGHVSFAPVLPLDGTEALEQVHRIRRRFEAAGFDYCGAFTAAGRSLVHVTEVLYDRDDAEQVARARMLVPALIAEAAAEGYGEYRGHLAFMDDIARSFDFNGGALGRLHARLKDALDPTGVLAPGKQGVWPARSRP
ncbi:FAD-binding oxidoreductase [Herbiconiux sp. KACC 21604]|uniref:FAD-binding oxidoreductase n=1 Tax=unclassified Herbiconiux TaxID=2618217 RepID=UPI001492CDB4|nr:FAD-binding oxidoreductase [Herbiconiux sp. SALV-R1]QJU54136.1 FAD-binding oxidoreductase [Herbiconiux sp. SALV-R1]WPO85189.1 FAD-binding oxidoreductase [Herbiconiux sp. KACC 21604]